MNGQLTEWGSSIAAFATAVSSLLQSPFAYVVFVLPALMAALVNRRGAAKLALLVSLAFVLAAAWLMSIEPGSRQATLLALGMLVSLWLVQQIRVIELSRLRQQIEAVRAEVAELHAGMERDLLASMRARELSPNQLREVTVEKSTREPELRPVRGSAS